jgi:hypothetical protein
MTRSDLDCGNLSSTSDLLRECFKRPRLVALQQLDLQQTIGCDDTVMGIVGECLPELRFLNVSETDITGVGVKQVVQRGQLQKLIANDCRNLGQDAVVWARAQGVQVEHKTTNVLAGGRKVRY